MERSQSFTIEGLFRAQSRQQGKGHRDDDDGAGDDDESAHGQRRHRARFRHLRDVAAFTFARALVHGCTSPKTRKTWIHAKRSTLEWSE